MPSSTKSKREGSRKKKGSHAGEGGRHASILSFFAVKKKKKKGGNESDNEAVTTTPEKKEDRLSVRSGIAQATQDTEEAVVTSAPTLEAAEPSDTAFTPQAVEASDSSEKEEEDEKSGMCMYTLHCTRVQGSTKHCSLWACAWFCSLHHFHFTYPHSVCAV
jgi:hypothetical protein